MTSPTPDPPEADDRRPTTAPASTARRVVAWVVVPAVLAATLLGQARLFREATCETYDEFTYLRMGICIFREDDFSKLASPMCPPLPILLEYWLPALSARALPDTPGWEPQVPELTRQARLLTSITIGVPLVWVVYGWLALRRGWAAGALGGGLVALSPTVVAAASIATTDACFALFALLALAAIHRYQVRPAWRTFLGASAAIGLALAAKQSAVVLAPVLMAEVLRRIRRRDPDEAWGDYLLRLSGWLAARLAALVAVAFTVDWACYLFRFAPPFIDSGTHMTIPILIPMVAALFPNRDAIMTWVERRGPPLALDTFYGQLNHATTGHPAFLMGRYSSTGWWYFFPVALAIKSTPAELVAFGLVLVTACRPSSWRDPTRRLWLLAAAAMLGAGMASRLNIGHRYMLLVYPLAALLAADALGELVVRRRLLAAALGLALLAGQAVSAVGIAPHYLSYFNILCGGPSEGYRYLVDSSLDWGQDLPSLRRELEARGYNKVALAYFGTAKPGSYGIRHDDWYGWVHPVDRGCDWLAISATVLQGVYGGATGLRQRFEGLETARAGYTIFLYDFRDPRVRAAYDALRHVDALPPTQADPP